MKNLTPPHMRCHLGESCPAIYRLPDGRLLIIGADGVYQAYADGKPLAPGESAVIIDPALLADVAQE